MKKENIKDFNDLKFRSNRVTGDSQSILAFRNKYQVSVITGTFSYGGDAGLYELAIIHNESLCYDTGITDDVIGYLTPEEVSEIMKKVQELKPKQEKQ